MAGGPAHRLRVQGQLADSITDLECAAVVWAIKRFRPYLYGRRFELVTDHNALSWLMKSKDLTGRLHRWSLQLQEYDFNVTYRPGSTNGVAGALSHAPVRQVVPGHTNGPTATEGLQGSGTSGTTTAERGLGPTVSSGATVGGDRDHGAVHMLRGRGDPNESQQQKASPAPNWSAR
jgi:hypothetical protein